MKPPADKSAPSSTRELRDDVVWDIDALDPADEFAVAPPDEAVQAHLRALRDAASPKVEKEETPPPEIPSFQFSLRQVLIAQAGLSLMFAVMRFIAPSLLAGALGVTVLIMAALVAIFQPEERSVLIVWWSTLALYLVACAMATVMG